MSYIRKAFTSSCRVEGARYQLPRNRYPSTKTYLQVSTDCFATLASFFSPLRYFFLPRTRCIVSRGFVKVFLGVDEREDRKRSRKQWEGWKPPLLFVRHGLSSAGVAVGLEQNSMSRDTTRMEVQRDHFEHKKQAE